MIDAPALLKAAMLIERAIEKIEQAVITCSNCGVPNPIQADEEIIRTKLENIARRLRRFANRENA